MSWEAWYTLGVIISLVATLVFTPIQADMLVCAALTMLLVAGILTPEQALAGFANEGLAVIAVLFVIAAGLRQTGAIDLISGSLLGRPRSVAGAQLRLMLPVATASSVMNNTPLVAVLVPAVRDWARRLSIPVSKLMMPLSYAAILGGLCTLIGTSTNLILAGLVNARGNLPTIHLLDPAYVGLPCALVGFGYILLASQRLLPERIAPLGLRSDPREYTAEVTVPNGSPVVGKTIEQAGLRQLPGLFLMEIEREGYVLPAVAPEERLLTGDRLVFTGVVESVVELQKHRGLEPADEQRFKLDAPPTTRCLIEAVVSDTCPLVGKSVREGRFRTWYNAVIVALARNGERVREKIGDITLQPGDALLVEAHPRFLERYRDSRDFFLVSPIEGYTPPRHDRARVALGILLCMVLCAAGGLTSLLNAALVAAGFMLLTRCCTGQEARRSVDWSLLVTLGGSFGVARALEHSGAAAGLADWVIGPCLGHPWLALVAVYFLTMLFAEFTSHAAAAVLSLPVALMTAQHLEVSPMPFIFGVMIAASCGFASPVGYQTNLMVQGPGGYEYRDYVRFGSGLNLVVACVALSLLPLVWPF